METRLAEILQRLAHLDNVPKETCYAGVYDEFLEHAEADVRWLVEQLNDRAKS